MHVEEVADDVLEWVKHQLVNAGDGAERLEPVCS